MIEIGKHSVGHSVGRFVVLSALLLQIQVLSDIILSQLVYYD